MFDSRYALRCLYAEIVTQKRRSDHLLITVSKFILEKYNMRILIFDRHDNMYVDHYRHMYVVYVPHTHPV